MSDMQCKHHVFAASENFNRRRDFLQEDFGARLPERCKERPNNSGARSYVRGGTHHDAQALAARPR